MAHWVHNFFFIYSLIQNYTNLSRLRKIRPSISIIICKEVDRFIVFLNNLHII